MAKHKTILFSGRFDPPHLGHFDTITDLGQRYSKVLVVILDHKEQEFPIVYRLHILAKLLNRCRGNYEVVVNTDHFGKITKKSADKYKFDVYGAGNMQVLKHMEQLGYQVEFVPRSGDFNAGDARKYQKVKEVLGG